MIRKFLLLTGSFSKHENKLRKWKNSEKWLMCMHLRDEHCLTVSLLILYFKKVYNDFAKGPTVLVVKLI